MGHNVDLLAYRRALSSRRTRSDRSAAVARYLVMGVVATNAQSGHKSGLQSLRHRHQVTKRSAAGLVEIDSVRDGVPTLAGCRAARLRLGDRRGGFEGWYDLRPSSRSAMLVACSPALRRCAPSSAKYRAGEAVDRDPDEQPSDHAHIAVELAGKVPLDETESAARRCGLLIGALAVMLIAPRRRCRKTNCTATPAVVDRGALSGEGRCGASRWSSRRRRELARRSSGQPAAVAAAAVSIALDRVTTPGSGSLNRGVQVLRDPAAAARRQYRRHQRRRRSRFRRRTIRFLRNWTILSRACPYCVRPGRLRL